MFTYIVNASHVGSRASFVANTPARLASGKGLAKLPLIAEGNMACTGDGSDCEESKEKAWVN